MEITINKINFEKVGPFALGVVFELLLIWGAVAHWGGQLLFILFFVISPFTALKLLADASAPHSFQHSRLGGPETITYYENVTFEKHFKDGVISTWVTIIVGAIFLL